MHKEKLSGQYTAYDWMNEDFFRTLRMSEQEVKGYRKVMVVKTILKTEAKRILEIPLALEQPSRKMEKVN